jgi:hypothetical protein
VANTSVFKVGDKIQIKCKSFAGPDRYGGIIVALDGKGLWVRPPSGNKFFVFLTIGDYELSARSLHLCTLRR